MSKMISNISPHFLCSSHKTSKRIHLVTYEEPQAYQILQFQGIIQKKFMQLHHKRPCTHVCICTYTCTSVPVKMYTTNAKQKCVCFSLWSVHYQEFPPLEVADKWQHFLKLSFFFCQLYALVAGATVTLTILGP